MKVVIMLKLWSLSLSGLLCEMPHGQCKQESNQIKIIQFVATIESEDCIGTQTNVLWGKMFRESEKSLEITLKLHPPLRKDEKGKQPNSNGAFRYSNYHAKRQFQNKHVIC